MKLQLFGAVFLSLFICQAVGAHSGGLDSKGGHYNRKTGEYHYHRGGNVDSKSTVTKSTKSKSETKTKSAESDGSKKKKR